MKGLKRGHILFIYVLLLSFLSLYPKIEPPVKNINFFDKYEHFVAYGLLMVLTLWTYTKISKSIIKSVLCFFCLAFYGLLIEVLQNFTGRSMELMDFIADIAGLVLGYFMYRIYFSRKKRHSA